MVTNKHLAVDGKPVEEWLERQEDKQRTEQARAVYRTEVYLPAVAGRMERELPKMIRARFNVHHVMTGRAVVYNDHLIRKEKGTMSKPYTTMIENCLDVIFNKAPQEALTNKKLAALLGKKAPDVASAMSRFLKQVPGVIVLEGSRPPRIYRVLRLLTVEETYKAYQDNSARAAADRAAVRKGVSPGTLEERVGPALGSIPQEIKITVQVTGSIGIIFGFKKE